MEREPGASLLLFTSPQCHRSYLQSTSEYQAQIYFLYTNTCQTEVASAYNTLRFCHHLVRPQWCTPESWYIQGHKSPLLVPLIILQLHCKLTLLSHSRKLKMHTGE